MSALPVAAAAPAVAIATSAGLRGIRHVERFVGVERVLSPAAARREGIAGDVVLAWGRRPSAAAAGRYAARYALPLWCLEDGWIRSSSRDAHASVCYSLLVDPVGVYYDSASPSAIETFLDRPDESLAADLDASALSRARACRERIVAAGITKYNWCRVPQLPDTGGAPLVLVVDQTRDDASVRHGGMGEADFVAMLDAARAENPGAHVVVRTHPDVVAGRRAGYLSAAARARGVALSAAGDNPLPWLRRAERVYVGTSQLGYEALICERPVTVFGQPFYAGWGLTDDRRSPPRRARARTIDQLFHAAHVHLARYRSPIDGEAWTLERCLDHVELQKREFRRNARHFLCSGVTPWKRRYVAQFLRSPDGSVRFGGERSVAGADTRVIWSYRDGRRRESDGARAAIPTWRIEDGFLRSAGLGSDFVAPGSLAIDSRGLYFDPATPSDLELLLAERDVTPAELLRASRLRRAIVSAGLSKYSIGGAGKPMHRAADSQHVLVVGQVESDESIRRGCSDVRDNTELLQATRKARPDAWIVYRPHPDVVAGNRPGKVDPYTLQSCADEVDVEGAIGERIEACDELHTMTSLAGFEALMRRRRVVTYGSPFYAGWGLTEDRATIARRGRRRTLDELVFLALIVYPRYLDIASGEFVTAEDMVGIIERQRRERMEGMTGRRGWSKRQIDRAANLARGLRYAP